MFVPGACHDNLCNVCGLRLTSPNKLMTHMKVRTSKITNRYKPQWQNPVARCNQMAEHVCGLDPCINGIMFSRSKPNYRHLETQTKKTYLSSKICGTIFKHKHALKKHIDTHLKAKRFKCNKCACTVR